jgi:hypothetical protein
VAKMNEETDEYGKEYIDEIENEKVFYDNLTAFEIIDTEIKLTEKVVNDIVFSIYSDVDGKYDELKDLYLSTYGYICLDTLGYLTLLRRATILYYLSFLNKNNIKTAGDLYWSLSDLKESLNYVFENLKIKDLIKVEISEKLEKEAEDMQYLVNDIIFNNKSSFEIKFNHLKRLYVIGFEGEENFKKDFFYFFRRVIMTKQLRFLIRKKNKEAKELYDALMKDKEVLEKLTIPYWY